MLKNNNLEKYETNQYKDINNNDTKTLITKD